MRWQSWTAIATFCSKHDTGEGGIGNAVCACVTVICLIVVSITYMVLNKMFTSTDAVCNPACAVCVSHASTVDVEA